MWSCGWYYDAGRKLGENGHEVYPVVEKKIRGVWLTNVASDVLLSEEGIEKAVERCWKASINTIFVVVYNNARTVYPS